MGLAFRTYFALFGIVMAGVSLLLWVPILDAWLNYGPVTGVVATLLLGPVSIGCIWMFLDVTHDAITQKHTAY